MLIPSQKSLLAEVHGEFSSRLSEFGTVTIAGGAVRDSLLGKMPKDFDVFILQGEKFDLEKCRPAIISVLSDLSEVKPKVDWHKSEPYLAATVLWRGQEIQVLCNPAPTLADLIGTFDWSVCLFGFDGKDYFRGEPLENIGPGKELRLQRVTFPVSTLRRGFRFSERFLMKLRRDDLATICRMILEKHAPAEPDMPALAANNLVGSIK